MDFDLVIQGPLDKTSIDQIDHLSHQFNNIVVSHWSENDSSLLSNIQSENVIKLSCLNKLAWTKE
ncbi:MAG: hypothetical protein ACXADW_13070 [Candidatus Hodarchaeales archaeon]|jgi:hypothetical protein